MRPTETVPMLLMHGGTPRDEEARRHLAEALPGAEISEPDETGAFDLTLTAADLEDALTRIWDAVAASGTDDHVVFLEHRELAEHWRPRSGRPGG